MLTNMTDCRDRDEPDSTVQAYQSLLSKFDLLIGSCDEHLADYSDCISLDGRKSQRCKELLSRLNACLSKRGERTVAVTTACAQEYSVYEERIRSGQDCVQELAELLVCARGVLPATANS